MPANAFFMKVSSLLKTTGQSTTEKPGQLLQKDKIKLSVSETEGNFWTIHIFFFTKYKTHLKFCRRTIFHLLCYLSRSLSGKTDKCVSMTLYQDLQIL